MFRVGAMIPNVCFSKSSISFPYSSTKFNTSAATHTQKRKDWTKKYTLKKILLFYRVLSVLSYECGFVKWSSTLPSSIVVVCCNFCTCIYNPPRELRLVARYDDYYCCTTKRLYSTGCVYNFNASYLSVVEWSWKKENFFFCMFFYPPQR